MATPNSLLIHWCLLIMHCVNAKKFHHVMKDIKVSAGNGGLSQDVEVNINCWEAHWNIIAHWLCVSCLQTGAECSHDLTTADGSVDTWHVTRGTVAESKLPAMPMPMLPFPRNTATGYILYVTLLPWPYHWNPSVIWSDVNCVLVYLHPPTASNHVIWVSSYFKCHNGFLITMFKNVI